MNLARSRFDSDRTGKTIRHRLPYPLAALYRHWLGEPDPTQQLRYALRLTDAALRIPAFISMADALCHGPSQEKADAWFKHLKRPELGGLKMLIGSTAKFTTAAGQPFVPEMADIKRLLDESQEMARLERNYLTHVVCQATKTEAVEALKVIQPDLEELLFQLCFLQHYELGRVHSVNRIGKKLFQIFWQPITGYNEPGDTLELKSRYPWPEKVILILDKRKCRGLLLHPLLRWVEPQPGRLEWLAALEPNDNREVIHYRHPIRVEGREAVKSWPFSSPYTPDSQKSMTQREWVKQHLEEKEQDPEQGMVWGFDLELDLPSAATLRRDISLDWKNDRFEFIGKLGSGGMGAVYEAVDGLLKRSVAIKVMNDSDLADTEAKSRFFQELRMLKELNHENVVSPHEPLDIDGKVGFSMELLEGYDLNSYVRKHGGLQPAEIIDVMRQVLFGLAHIHDRRVFHRDLKPQNVFKCHDGLVKIIDFGVARAVDMTRLTRPGTRTGLGTERYMAPEQRDCPSMVDHLADVYSAGRLLYFLMEAEDPTPHNETFGYPRPEITNLVSAQHRALDAIYQRATQYRPMDRYQSADEMRDAFETLTTGAALEEVTVDAHEGEKGVRKAAEAGDLQAMCDLGAKLLDAAVLAQDIEEGEQWLLKAAEAGHADAMAILGGHSMSGELGLPEDAEKGERWLRKAAEAAHAWAMQQLGIYLVEGYFGRQNIEEGEQWLRKAARAGAEDATFYLGQREAVRDEREYFGAFSRWVTESDWGNLRRAVESPLELSRQELVEIENKLLDMGLDSSRLEASASLYARCDQTIRSGVLGCILYAANRAKLLPLEVRVDYASKYVDGLAGLDTNQQKWLGRILKQVRHDTIVDEASLDSGLFRSQGGGFSRLDRLFNGETSRLLREIRKQMWPDVLDTKDPQAENGLNERNS